MKTAMNDIDAHLRTRLRVIIWKQWKGTEETSMGTAETRHKKRPCTADGILWRPLSMGSDENMCCQGNLKREAITGRACELL